jgi:hypothetical protein
VPVNSQLQKIKDRAFKSAGTTRLAAGFNKCNVVFIENNAMLVLLDHTYFLLKYCTTGVIKVNVTA